MSKLPSEVRLQIVGKNTSEVWNIGELLEAVKTDIEAKESSEGTKTSGSNNQKFNNRNQRPTGANAFLTKTQQGDKIRCVLCDKCNYSASCDVVKSHESRKQILAKTGRCYNCLRKGHQAKDCFSEKNCRHCNKRHHQSICDIAHVRGSENPEELPKQDSNEPATLVTTATSHTNGRKRNSVLLQTERAIATHESGDNAVRV